MDKKRLLIFTLLIGYAYASGGQNLNFLSNLLTADGRKNASVDFTEWWGCEASRLTPDKSIRPFKIEFLEEMIEDLRYRLVNHRRFTPNLDGMGFRYGFSSQIMEDWVQHWAYKYPFQDRETYLNRYPMFKTNIQGLDVQFIWIKPAITTDVPVLPLLMLHGWPGSIREFYETIPFLTSLTSRGFSVELVIPSLPGFGFSESSARPGLGAVEISVIMRNLMYRLGHKQFYVQGGDIGSIINLCMCTLFPETVMGFHSNLATALSLPAILLLFLGSLEPQLIVEPELSKRMYPLSKTVPNLFEELGYFLEQSTRPDTIGIALSDSPAALLAYVLEKFSSGTNSTFKILPDGGLNTMNKDFLIDNLMLYWVPNSMTTAMRFYANTFNKRTFGRGLLGLPTPVPFWALQAKNELVYQPPPILKTKYPNLINATALNFGGRFIAFEHPKVFAENVLDALQAFKKWHKENEVSINLFKKLYLSQFMDRLMQQVNTKQKAGPKVNKIHY